MRKATSGRFNYYVCGATYIRANVIGAEVIDAPPKGLKFHESEDVPKHVLFLSTCEQVCKPDALTMLGRRMMPDGSFSYTRPGSLVELNIGQKLEVRRVWLGWGWEECKASALNTEEFNLAHHPVAGSLAFNSMGKMAEIVKIDEGYLLAHLKHENYPMPFAQLERIVPGATVRTFPEGQFITVDQITQTHIISKEHAYAYSEIASNKMVFAGDMLAGGSIYKGDPSITKVAVRKGPQRVFGGKWFHYTQDIYVDVITGKTLADASIAKLESRMPTHSEWMALIKCSPINEEIFVRTKPHSKMANEIKRDQKNRLKDMLVKFAVDSINEGDYMTARQTLDLLIQGDA